MSIFGRIKEAIFGHRGAAGQAGAQPAGSSGQASPAPNWSTAAQEVTEAQTQPVDVEQVLGQIAAEKGNPDLNYRSSIVDLMKLLDMDSSLDNRKELATELGYQGPKDGSAEMNLWLHREVMRQLAANGGRVPASLTD